MKLTRKLIPAFAMLLVSAVLMSTASFAWFSMNQTVTATGIEVTATAPESLTISVTSATAGFGSAVTLTNDNAATMTSGGIYPVTAYTKASNLITGNKFFKLTADAAKTVNEAGVLTGNAATADVEEGTYYTEATTTDVYAEHVWLKLDGSAAAKELKVKATYTTTPATDIAKAFHVLFVDASGALLADIDMGTDADTVVDLDSATVSATATEIIAFFYLDGTDTDCKNANIQAAVTAAITLEFSFA